ncbi:MAG: hypothetical protein K2H85_07845, partial [Allobaculum sp.]|nr:hypothetical protein [Allobaculum sp.]
MFTTRQMLLELRTPICYSPQVGLLSVQIPQGELYDTPWLEKVRYDYEFRRVANRLIYGVGASKSEEDFFKKFDITTMIDHASKQQTVENFNNYLKDFLFPVTNTLLWSNMFELKFESAFASLILVSSISIIPAQMDVVIPGEAYSRQFFLSLFQQWHKLAQLTCPKVMFTNLLTKEHLTTLRHIYPPDLPWYNRDRLLRKDRKFLVSALQALEEYRADIALHVDWVLETEHIVQYEHYDEIETVGNFDVFLRDVDRGARHDLPYTYHAQWPKALREKIASNVWYPHVLEFLLEPALYVTESSYWRPNVYLLMIAAKLLQCAYALRKSRDILPEDFYSKQNALIDDLFSIRQRERKRGK